MQKEFNLILAHSLQLFMRLHLFEVTGHGSNTKPIRSCASIAGKFGCATDGPGLFNDYSISSIVS